VAGFDGVAMAAHSEPPLTTLDIPVYEIGSTLVSLLAGELKENKDPNRKLIYTPNLLKRLSTCATPP
jgi:LacI family transcriptional regulator